MPTLPRWTWVLPFFIANLGTWFSLWAQQAAGADLWYLPPALGLVLIYWWGPRVLVGIYLNALLSTPLWGGPWQAAPLMALNEVVEVGLSWLLFVELGQGDCWLPNLKSSVQFLLVGAIVPTAIANIYKVVLLHLLGIAAYPALVGYWLRFLSCDLAAQCVITLPALTLLTQAMNARGWVRLGRLLVPEPWLPVARTGVQEHAFILAALTAILLLSLVSTFYEWWIVYGLLLVALALRYGVKLAVLGASWTGFLALFLPPLLWGRLGVPSGHYTGEILFLCVVSLLTGRAISDLFTQVAERKQAELALRENETKYRTLFEAANDAIFLFDRADLHILAANPAACALFGYTLSELQQLNILDLSSEPQITAAAIRSNVVHVPLRYHRKKDGTRFPGEVSMGLFTLADQTMQVSFVRDITARRRTEAILQERQHFIQRILDTEPSLVYIYDLQEAHSIYVNRQLARVLGYTPEEVLTLALADFVHPEDTPLVLAHIAQLQTALHGEVLEIEYRTCTKDGRWLWLYNRTTVFAREPNGELRQVLGVAQDITEQRQVAMTLRQTQEDLAATLNALPDFMFELDSEGRYYNFYVPYPDRLFVAPSDFLGRTVTEMLPAEPARIILQALRAAAQTGSSVGAEYALLQPNGLHWFELSIARRGDPYRDDAHFIVLARDITDRKQAEAALQLLVEVTTIASEADDVESVIARCLETIGRLRQWPLGQAWLLEVATSRVVCFPNALYAEIEVPEFRQASLATHFVPGMGWLGQVWENQRPVWLTQGEEAQSQNMPHVMLAFKAGLKAAFSFPIYHEAQMLAIFEFFSPTFHPPEAVFLAVLERLGANLALVFARKQAEAELRQAEERFRHAFDFAAVGMALVAPRGRWLKVNAALCSLLGYSAQELLNKSMQDISYPPDLAADQAYMRQMLAQEIETYQMEKRYVHKQGYLVWTLLSVSLVYDGEHQPLYFVKQIQDITQRKLAESNLEHRNQELTALNAIAIAISQTFDVEKLISVTLRTVMDVMHVTGGWVQLLENNQLRLIEHPGFPTELVENLRVMAFEKIASGGEVVTQVLGRLRASDTETRLWVVPPVFLGVQIQAKDKFLGVLGVSRQWPLAFAPQEAQLLTTIGHELGVAIENVQLAEQAAQAEILREVDRLRAELIANVSHELRTPLGLIMFMTTTLLRQDAIFDADLQREFLQDMAAETRKLTEIVDNLLDASRLQNGRLKLDRQLLDLGWLAQTTLEAMQPQLVQHRWVCEVALTSMKIFADAKRIEQVIRNLLTNAVKYSSPDTVITLKVEPGPDAGTVQLLVSDQGLGIGPEDLPHIFERFYRSKQEQVQRVSGTGLGLPICQGIVEAHGGHIWAESQPGVGSVFYVVLPWVEVEPLLPAP